jgi:hypothetical protein
MRSPPRIGLAPVVLGTVLVGLGYLSAFLPGGAARAGAWLLLFGIALLVTGLIALGAARRGRLGLPLLAGLAFTFVVLVGCFGAALLLPANEHAGSRLLGGLPLRAALVLYGVGFLPALVLPWLYASTFATMTLDQADIDRIRAARPLPPPPPPPPPPTP